MRTVSDVAYKIPAPILFLTSGVSQYTGAACAVGLFALMTPATMAWWRITIAALVLIVWRQPWKRHLSAREWMASALFGVVMTGMNIAFYEAIARLDMGIVVALEFIGPVALAVCARRHWRSWLGSALALTGVVLICGISAIHTTTTTIIGIAYSLLAGGLWAIYMILGQRIATTRSGTTSLAIGCAASSVIYLPIAVHDAAYIATSPTIAIAVIAVGILSTVIPYTLDQVALHRLDTSTFAILTALLPVTSLVVGALTLHQIPAPASIAGVLCVSLAVAIVSQRERNREAE